MSFLSEHHAMKTCKGSGGIAPRILDLGTRWRWVANFTSRPLYPQGKSPCYPLHRRLGSFQNRSGHGGEEKNPQPLPGLEPPTFQPVAQRYTTELWRLFTETKLNKIISSHQPCQMVKRNQRFGKHLCPHRQGTTPFDSTDEPIRFYYFPVVNILYSHRCSSQILRELFKLSHVWIPWSQIRKVTLITVLNASKMEPVL
jgi:hypothetical protein